MGKFSMLNTRQKTFVREYLIDLNATRAAIAAGYSEGTAGQIGSRLLKNVNIQTQVSRAVETRLERLGITADRVLRELARVAFYDPRKFFNADGTVRNINELDEDTAAAIAGLEVFEEFAGSGEERELIGYTKKFKLPDKGANLERLARHMGLIKNGSDDAGKVTFNILTVADKTSADECIDKLRQFMLEEKTVIDLPPAQAND